MLTKSTIVLQEGFDGSKDQNRDCVQSGRAQGLRRNSFSPYSGKCKAGLPVHGLWSDEIKAQGCERFVLKGSKQSQRIKIEGDRRVYKGTLSKNTFVPKNMAYFTFRAVGGFSQSSLESLDRIFNTKYTEIF